MLEKIALWNLYEKEEEEDVAASQPARPKKRARLEDDETDETAEEEVEYQVAHYPIAADDPDRLRFQGRIRSLIDIRSEEDMPTAQWMKLPRSQRAMTRGFRNMLVESDVEELARAILHRIPQQSQQILGRQNLKAVDLLDLPRVSKNFPHRLTYPDAAVDNKNNEELLQRKRAKFEDHETDETVEDWIKYLNTHYLVPANDPDLRCFQAGIQNLIKKLIDWSHSSDEISISHWMKLPRRERAMTCGFRNVLMQSDAAQLPSAILNHIPHKSQQILGRQEVQPIDLLDLPRMPSKFFHRLTYVVSRSALALQMYA
ncbi:hypothetical protein NW754_003714 [Fusarium falciforme]|nr:hypothetical protein NW754_003714 [Fusarium falciforme]KAJ4210515.1 hypothetical protein NW767_000788 [Fusarium falciforme]KAJ4250474.1 hypothetical protein NW757_007306 [Fusarium falciforme]